MTLMVRQLQPTETGLPMELYFFTDTVVWVDYERIQSDVFDHVPVSYTHLDVYKRQGELRPYAGRFALHACRLDVPLYGQ